MEKAAGWFAEEDVAPPGLVWFVRWCGPQEFIFRAAGFGRDEFALKAVRPAPVAETPWRADLEKHLVAGAFR